MEEKNNSSGIEKNPETYNNIKNKKYTEMFDALYMCIEHRFYYGALFIEYGIIEERLASVWHTAGENPLNNKGYHKNITDLLKGAIRIENSSEDILPKDYHSLADLNKDLVTWLNTRNGMEHRMMDEPLEDGKAEKVALDGLSLTKEVRNRSGRLEYWLGKKNGNNKI